MKIYFDEAGRGPLFGPLYIGLVISSLSAQELKKYELFQDSKKLTPKQRKVALEQIETLEKQGKLQTALGTIDAESIDRYGITRAINLA
ncbi:MAG: ribonuclease HII, partial [candidate division SR1 bacterium]